MAEIIDNEEIDKDTVDPEILDQQFSKKYKLLTEKHVSLKKSYVNKLCVSKSLQVAVSQSDHSIEVYQLNNSSLSRVCRLSGHPAPAALTELVACPTDEHMLYSCGSDGLIRLWDTRASGTCAQEYKEVGADPQRQLECMDMSCNGRMLCAGSALVQDDAFLVFWDTRQLAGPLGGYWNSHSDDISQIRFHPTKPALLCSGAADGFVNIYNILEATEDDALTYCIGVDNAVERLSWLDEGRVACVTQSNELRVCDAACGDVVGRYPRHKVARAIRRSAGDDCYLVDAFTDSDGSAVLLAGSHGGGGDVLRSVTFTDKRLQPCTLYTANTQTVRCTAYCTQRDILITGGEGGIISVWARDPSAASVGNTHTNGDTKLETSMCKLHVNRYKPY